MFCAAASLCAAVASATAGDVEARTPEGGKQSLFNAAEKVQPVDVAAVNGTGLGQAVEGADAGREVIPEVDIGAQREGELHLDRSGGLGRRK